MNLTVVRSGGVLLQKPLGTAALDSAGAMPPVDSAPRFSDGDHIGELTV
jgi:hypothetical protein